MGIALLLLQNLACRTGGRLILEELAEEDAAKTPAAPEPAPAAETPPAPARPAYNPEPIRGFSRHCTEKAEAHTVTTISHGLAAARYEVRSGESGRTYHVILTRHRASCDCPLAMNRSCNGIIFRLRRRWYYRCMYDGTVLRLMSGDDVAGKGCPHCNRPAEPVSCENVRVETREVVILSLDRGSIEFPAPS